MPSKKGKKGRKNKRQKKFSNKRSATPQPDQQQSDVAAAAVSASVPPPYSNLRFTPGDIILAQCGDYWRRGKITKCNIVGFEDSGPARFAYAFVSESGDPGSVPEDTDQFIRPFSKEVLLTLAGPAPEPLVMDHEFPAGMVELRAFELVKTIMTGNLPKCHNIVWPKFQSLHPSLPAVSAPGCHDSSAAVAVIPHAPRNWIAWHRIFDEQLKFLLSMSRHYGSKYPGMSALLWLQKSNPALFEHSRVEPDRLELPVNKRTIFHELALANPTKVRNAIAFNFVSYESGDVSQTRKKQNLPWRIIPGTNRRDIYGWKPSDYLVAKGAMDSLLWMCMWVMATHHIHGVCAAFKKQRRTKSPSVNFIWITQCLDLFAGPDNVLKQVPPELSVALGGADWPAAGKSPRQLAQDHGHKDIVEFIDFIQFHEEGSSLFSYVQSRAAFKDGSFKAAKLAAKTFSGFVEAGRANTRIVETQYWIRKCCKPAFLTGAHEFLQWCQRWCPDLLRSTLSPHRAELLTRLACESRPAPRDYGILGIRADALDVDRDIGTAAHEFRLCDKVTRQSLRKTLLGNLSHYSIDEQSVMQPRQPLRAFDFVQKLWFKHWDAEDDIVSVSVLNKVVDVILRDTVSGWDKRREKTKRLMSFVQQTMRMAGIGWDVHNGSKPLDEPEIKAKALKHVAEFATDRHGKRFGTAARVQIIRMLHKELGTQYCRGDIDMIAQRCAKLNVCIAPSIWEAILDSSEVSIDQVGQTLLDVAIRCDSVPTVAWLINTKGVDPLQRREGQNALARAATHLRCFTVKWLVVNVGAFDRLWCDQAGTPAPDLGSAAEAKDTTTPSLCPREQRDSALGRLVESCASLIINDARNEVDLGDPCGLAYNCCKFLFKRCGEHIAEHLQYRCSNGKTVKQVLAEMVESSMPESSYYWRSLLNKMVERVPEDPELHVRVEEILNARRQRFRSDLLELDGIHGSDAEELLHQLPKLLREHGVPPPYSCLVDTFTFQPESRSNHLGNRIERPAMFMIAYDDGKCMPSAVLMWTIEVALELLQQKRSILLEWTIQHIPGWHVAVLQAISWYVSAGKQGILVHAFFPNPIDMEHPLLKREKQKVDALAKARRQLKNVGKLFLDMWMHGKTGSRQSQTTTFDARRADELVTRAGSVGQRVKRLRSLLPARVHSPKHWFGDNGISVWVEPKEIVTLVGHFFNTQSSKLDSVQKLVDNHSFALGLVNGFECFNTHAEQRLRWLFQRYNIPPVSPIGKFCSAACVQYGKLELFEVLESLGFEAFDETAAIIAVLCVEFTQIPPFLRAQVSQRSNRWEDKRENSKAHEDAPKLRQLKRICRRLPGSPGSQSLHPVDDTIKILRAFLLGETTLQKEDLEKDKYGEMPPSCFGRYENFTTTVAVEQQEAIAILEYLESCGYVLPANHEVWREFALALLQTRHYNYYKIVGDAADKRYVMLLPRWLFTKKGVIPSNEMTARLFPGDGVALCPKVVSFTEIAKKRFELAESVREDVTVASLHQNICETFGEKRWEAARELQLAMNRRGQGLLEIVIVFNKPEVFAWLVNSYGLDPSGTSRDGMSLASLCRFDDMGQYEALVRSHSAVQHAATRLQANMRRFLCRKEHGTAVSKAWHGVRDHLPAWGVLHNYVLSCEIGRTALPGPWGSWTQLLKAKEFVHSEEHFTDEEERERWKQRSGLIHECSGLDVSADGDKVGVNNGLKAARECDKHDKKNQPASHKKQNAVIAVLKDQEACLNSYSESEISDSGGMRDMPAPVSPSAYTLNQAPKVVIMSKHAVKELKAFRSTWIAKRFAQLTMRLQVGDSSYALKKRLNRRPNLRALFECKLDKGMRILYLEQGREIQIRHICKHDHISKFVELIDKSEARLSRDLVVDAVPAISAENDEAKHADLESDESMELDENGNMPLRFYDLPKHILVRLSETPLFVHQWRPTLHLTRQETSIVKRTNRMTMVLGRSGTGKTFCICGRMDFDASAALASTKKAAPKVALRQVFIAGTRRVVAQAQRLRSSSCAEVDTAKYFTMQEFLRQIETTAFGKRVFDSAAFLSWTEFSTKFWESLGKRRKSKSRGRISKHKTTSLGAMFALTVWTEIRSRIKGSHRLCRSIAEASGSGTQHRGSTTIGVRSSVSSAAVITSSAADSVTTSNNTRILSAGSDFTLCLTREQYLALGVKECRLTQEQRMEVYDVFERYEAYRKSLKKWDSADRMLQLLRQLLALPRRRTCLYDKAYVDECQDHTQIEYAIVLVACGCRSESLCLAGDTAQAVAEGVDFRFPECRSMVHAMLGRDDVGIDKPIQLFRNFRSHSGILNVANIIVTTLMRHFKGCVDKCLPDKGLSNGPRPQMCRAWIDANPLAVLHALFRQNERRRVLVWDEHRDEYSVGPLSGFVFGIRESKGLEHSHVILVDFFCNLPTVHHQAWKWLATGSGKPPTLPIELVLQLKMLYVGITRCCQELIFVETRNSPAGNAWIRHLTAREKLAVEVKSSDFDAISDVTMGPDEWLVEGLSLLDSNDFNVDGPDVGNSLSTESIRLKQASACFLKAGNRDHESRCLLQNQLLQHCISASASGVGQSVITTFAASLVRCLEEGLIGESTRVLRQYAVLLLQHDSNGVSGKDTIANPVSELVRRLASRIEVLSKK